MGDFVAANRLVDNGVTHLFWCTSDILDALIYSGVNGDPPVRAGSSKHLDAIPNDLKHACWTFYIKLIQGQMENLRAMRVVFFNLIRYYPKHYTEELHYRLEMLKALTENGKNVSYFRAEIGEFMLTCYVDEIIPNQPNRATLAVPFLRTLINIVKNNSLCLEQKTIAGLIENTCKLIETTRNDELIRWCLALFEVVPGCSYLPPETLNSFTESLCITVHMPEHREMAWKIMNSMLVTHLGHAVIKSMCVFLQDRIYHTKVNVLRGAVHFIGNTLWGEPPQRVMTLKHKPDAILPSFVHACECRQPLVGFEVAHAVSRLVKKQGTSLPLYTWGVIIDVCETLVNNFDMTQANATGTMKAFIDTVYELFTDIEQLEKENCFLGSVERFHAILEKCSATRSEDSAYNLIDCRAKSIDPSKASWLDSLKKLMETFFRHERRTRVRLRALDVLASVLSAYRHTHEELLIDSIALEFLGQIHLDTDW